MLLNGLMRRLVGFTALGLLACSSGCSHQPPVVLEGQPISADNEIWRVVDLQLTQDDIGQHYTFEFSPGNRNNPSANPQTGCVPAADVLAVAPAESAAAVPGTQVIIVRRGSIYQPSSSIVEPEPGGVPESTHAPAANPNAPATQPVRDLPANTRTPASPA